MKSPHSHRKIGALDWICLRAIAWYQRQISPRKGWRCAHARLHGGPGCSGFAREAIANHGLREAKPLIRARFDDCKLASQTLRSQQPGANRDSKQRRRHLNKGRDSKTDWCANFDCTPLQFLDGRFCRCADSMIDCGPGDTGCCGIDDCHTPHCH